MSQNGYWDQNGQWIAEAEHEAQVDAVAEAENTRFEMALEDPASVVEIASEKAGKAIERAKTIAGDAQVLHMHLRSQKTTNLVGNVRHALKDLMRRNTSAKLKTQLGKMDDHWQVLKHCHGSMDSQRCRQMSRKALIGMAHDARAAAAAVDHVAALGRVVKRRTYPILDLLRMMGTGTANPPDLAPSPWPSQRTADQPLGTGGTRSPFEDIELQSPSHGQNGYGGFGGEPMVQGVSPIFAWVNRPEADKQRRVWINAFL